MSNLAVTTDDTTALGEVIENGRLIILEWNGYGMTLDGSVANLREVVDLVTPVAKVRSMVLYVMDIREPHERNGWLQIESWNYTRLVELRNSTSKEMKK